MIGILEFKKKLGEQAKELTEEEIIELRDNQDQMAEILFNMWLKEIKNNKIEV